MKWDETYRSRSTVVLPRASYTSLADLLIRDDRPALQTTVAREFITHGALRKFVTDFRLPVNCAARTKPVVAIALPNGPVLAATCIAVATYYQAAPVHPTTGVEQFRADILRTRAALILTTTKDYERLQLKDTWVAEAGIQVVLVEWGGSDNIELRHSNGGYLSLDQKPEPNNPDDVALILFTSGTSGTKKVVPWTVRALVTATSFVITSFGLTSDDVCLNMMPLHHIGGLVRNVLAPVLSGGSTVCCSAFDATMFWDAVENIGPTWYYASPSMHRVILSESTSRPLALAKMRIRLVCNAAGGLLPSLANRLQETFNCPVLPSYGMTECLPISAPPLDYALDREGTSGVSVGPELTILDGLHSHVKPGTVGRICVRGGAIFQGYLNPDGSLDNSCFNRDGWFDTGDLGYLDNDGYLYITGRSKEVVNRGGELISPFEVEDAIMSAAMTSDSPISGRISQALAFSVGHDVLQEVVAVALVIPSHVPRVDLRALHGALRSSLQQAKWPAMIVYMDDLPRRNTKLLRTALGSRLALPEMTDNTTYLQRHWQACCPLPETPISEPIASERCVTDLDLVSTCLSRIAPGWLCHIQRSRGREPELFMAPAEDALIQKPNPRLQDELQEYLRNHMHGYMIPQQIRMLHTPFPRQKSGYVDEVKLMALFEQVESAWDSADESTEARVASIFAQILSRHAGDIDPRVDFFTLGGDSLAAGRLISELRKTFKIQPPIELVFTQGTVAAIAAEVDVLMRQNPMEEDEERNHGCGDSKSSTNGILLLAQLIPLAVVYPMLRAAQWTLFMVALHYCRQLPTNATLFGRLLNILLAVGITFAITSFVFPFVGIAAKWIIIGRHREGLYPMWGWYHTRWWLVQKIVQICGKGVFEVSYPTECMYHRLLGAKIGKNVTLDEVSLGEWDLLDIGDNTTLSKCICRPFAAEANTSMYMGRITIGRDCSVGVASVIAPGSVLPPNTCIGVNSSSWEMEEASEEYRDLAPSCEPRPHWLATTLLTAPILVLSWVLCLAPWAVGIMGMLSGRSSDRDRSIRDALQWCTTSHRIFFHSLGLALQTLLGPLVKLLYAYIVKRLLDLVFGRLQPSPAARRRFVDVWRADLMKLLFPVTDLFKIKSIFGPHYEATSVAFRMLGAKVGKRVFWPGTGPEVQDYHLLDVGNDVVFGSYVQFITSDGLGSEKITVEDNCMIADRVCLLAGASIGAHTVMGSGAATRRGKSYPAYGTYIGSRGGDSVCLSSSSDARASSEKTPMMTLPFSKESKGMHRAHVHDALRQNESSDSSSLNDFPGYQYSDSDSEPSTPKCKESPTPFGRAVYMGIAPYHVFGQITICCYSAFATVFTALYWSLPHLMSIKIVNAIMYHLVPWNTDIWSSAVAIWGLASVSIAALTAVYAFVALGITVAAKWILLRQRAPGNYNWDKSSYNQRWKLWQSTEKLRVHCCGGQGVLSLLTGTRWIVWYYQALGANIGRDCAIYANGQSNGPMTEPDLLSIGDRVAVDDASLVSHTNSRGKFDLNRLEIGDGCVLRTGSRMLGGGSMEKNSCLLEHTLIMGGDVVEEGWTMQGWPAKRFRGLRVNVAKT